MRFKNILKTQLLLIITFIGLFIFSSPVFAVETYTVTYPDNHTETYEEGDELTLGINSSTKDSVLYVITLKYHDEVTNDATHILTKIYIANGWLANNTHYDDNDVIIVDEDITLQYDYQLVENTINLPTPAREDYLFEGWNDNAQGLGNFYTDSVINAIEESGNLTLHAIWNDEFYTVTFDSQGGSDVDDVVRLYNRALGTLEEPEKAGYNFAGWFTDTTYTNEIDENTLVRRDITYYARWVEETFPIEFEEIEPYVFDGSKYINTHVKLYDEDNYLSDFEIGFTIEAYNPSSTTRQGVFVNAKYENTSLKWPGFVFRKYDDSTTLLEATESINVGDKAQDWIDITDMSYPIKISIIRQDHKIYFNYNDGPYTFLQDMTTLNDNSKHNIETWFGAAPNGSGNPFRYVKATLSNMYIKRGERQADDEYKIVFPDNHVEYHQAGDVISLGTNTINKPDYLQSKVTFKFQDEETADEFGYVNKTYTINGWNVYDTHYDDDTSFIVDGDAIILPDYVETVIPADYPTEPTRTNYVFDGWFDDNNQQYSTYGGDDDITLYGKWSFALPSEITLDENYITLVKGNTYQIAVNNIPQESVCDYLYSGYNSSVLSVDSQGLITSLDVGLTDITISVDGDSSVNTTLTVNVISDVIESNTYDITEKDMTGDTIKIIIGLEPETSITDYLLNIVNDNQYINIYDSNGTLIDPSDYNDTLITTGMIIKLIVDNNEYDEVLVIVRGDINKDGRVNITDSSIVSSHILRIELIDDYTIYAADIVETDGSTIDDAINIVDNTKIDEYILRITNSLND